MRAAGASIVFSMDDDTSRAAEHKESGRRLPLGERAKHRAVLGTDREARGACGVLENRRFDGQIFCLDGCRIASGDVGRLARAGSNPVIGCSCSRLEKC